MFAAYLSHEDWQQPLFFVADTEGVAEQRALSALLAATREERDFDEFPDDQDWLDECLSDEWCVEYGPVQA